MNLSSTVAWQHAYTFSHNLNYPEIQDDVIIKENPKDFVGPDGSIGKIIYKGIEYMSNMIVCIHRREELPLFGKIDFMKIQDKKLILTIQEMKTQYYCEQFCAYKVELIDEKVELSINNLNSKYPLSLQTPIKRYNDLYVNPKFINF